jgi:hypothetical protein
MYRGKELLNLSEKGPRYSTEDMRHGLEKNGLETGLGI